MARLHWQLEVDNPAQARQLTAHSATLDNLAKQLDFTQSAVHRMEETLLTMQETLNASAEWQHTINTTVSGLSVSLETVEEATQALQGSIVTIEGYLSDLAAATEVKNLKALLQEQANQLEQQALAIARLQCAAGVGLDACGVCNGDNNTCCPDHHQYGTGRDGSFSVSFNPVLQTWKSPGRTVGLGVAYRVTPPAVGASEVACFGTCHFDGIEAGDEVLLISIQGVLNDYADVGNREFHLVKSTGNLLVFQEPVKVSLQGQSAAAQFVIVQRVPHFERLTIVGSVLADPWNGGIIRAAGDVASGLVVMRVQNQLEGGFVRASGAGFRPGGGSASGFCQYGYNGEGINQVDL